jgi:hypothetical protein
MGKFFAQKELHNIMSNAAFISGGMHLNVNKLDNAKESADTGCLEFVNAACAWSVYIEDLYDCAMASTDFESVGGVFEYDVCEQFGTWFMQEAIDTGELPLDAPVRQKLIDMVVDYAVEPNLEKVALRQKLEAVEVTK